MKFSNLGPPYCMPRPKMMRKSWTLKVRLQYILARGLLQKKMMIMNAKKKKKKKKKKKQQQQQQKKKKKPKGDGYVVSPYLSQRVENL